MSPVTSRSFVLPMTVSICWRRGQLSSLLLYVQLLRLVFEAGLLRRIGEGKEVRVGLQINRTIRDDGRAIDRRADVGFADEFLFLGGGEHHEVAVLVADIHFAVGHE